VSVHVNVQGKVCVKALEMSFLKVITSYLGKHPYSVSYLNTPYEVNCRSTTFKPAPG